MLAGTYRNVLFRLDGQDYLAQALMFIPGIGERITLQKDGEFRPFRVIAAVQTKDQTIIGIEGVPAE